MQVTELSAQGLKRSYKIKVEAAAINAQIDAGLKVAGERVKIPGFRPGLVPMKILKQRYGRSVQDDVLNRVMNQSTRQVLDEKNLRAAMQPQVDVNDYSEGGDFEFTVNVEILPPIPDVGFEKITLEKPVFEVAESDIDEALAKIVERSPQFTKRPKEEAARTGDMVDMDFVGKMDGVAFEGGTAKGYRIELGSNQFIAGFEEGLIGAKAGEERELKLKFPKEYHAPELAGRDVIFEVKVNEVQEAKTPKPDEEFARARGFADLRALREAVRDQIIKEYGMAVRNKLKRQLFDALEEVVNFDIPGSMLELEFNNIWSRVEQAKKEGDPQMKDKSEAELREEYDRIARRRVRLGLLLSDVARKNNLQIASEELTRALMQYASMFPGQEKQVVDFYRQNTDRLDDLRGPILEEKAVDWILEKVKVNEKKVTLTELNEENEEEESAPKGKKSKGKKAE